MNKIDTFFQETYPKNSYLDVLQTFLNKRRKKVAEPTVHRLFYNLHPIGEKFDEDTPIDALTRNWLKEYVDKRWLDSAPDTMRTRIADIRQFFKWCKKKGHLPKNVAKRLKPIRRRRQRRSKAAPEKHIKLVIQHISKKIDHLVYRDENNKIQHAPKKFWHEQDIKYCRDLFITVFLYETGARGGELSNLGSHTMNEVTKEKRDTYMVTMVGKTNDRDYLFTKRTAELWRLWQKLRPEECQEYAVIGWGRAHSHDQFSTNGISQMLLRRCDEIGIKPFRTHSLRHAKVKRSRQAVGLEVTSHLIDHSNIDTTRGYANIDEEELSEAALKTGLQYDIWE